MVCGSCVEKLAKRLIANHSKLDLIRAFELAEKAVERIEAHKPKPVEFEGVRSVSKEEKVLLGFDPDYSTACSVSGTCSCYGAATRCTEDIDCLNPTDTCACSCPPPPKANSHYVSNTCSSTKTYNCACDTDTLRCISGRTCKCGCGGYCYYSCDDGYVWNPVTQQCEPLAVRRVAGDGLTWTIF